MSLFKNILLNLPEVKGPIQKKLPFKEKLKWSLIILVSFYILSNLPLANRAPRDGVCGALATVSGGSSVV